MDGHPPADRAFRGPATGLTLADCIMIVFGAGIALSVAGDGPEAMIPGMPNSENLRWCLRLGTVANVIGGACLALLCAMPLRVRRLDRSIGAGGLLLAVVAGMMLSDAADRSAWIADAKVMVPIPGGPNRVFIRPGWPFWLTHAVVLLSGLGAAIALVFRRRRSPLAWSLLAIGVALSNAWLHAPISQAEGIWFNLHPAPLTLTTQQVVRGLEAVLTGLIPSVLVILAIGDLVRRPRSFGAADWAGVILATAWIVASRASSWLLASAFGMPASLRVRMMLIPIGGDLLAMTCAFLLLIAYRGSINPARRTRP